MNELIIYYLLGALISSSIITIWNFSSISIHLLSWIYKDKEIITIEDMGDAISEKHPNIAELLYCPTCLGFWVSLATATCIKFINDLTYWFIPCAISWPIFILIFYYYFYDDSRGSN